MAIDRNLIEHQSAYLAELLFGAIGIGYIAHRPLFPLELGGIELITQFGLSSCPVPRVATQLRIIGWRF